MVASSGGAAGAALWKGAGAGGATAGGHGLHASSARRSGVVTLRAARAGTVVDILTAIVPHRGMDERAEDYILSRQQRGWTAFPRAHYHSLVEVERPRSPEQQPDAPLDNNIVERSLKKAILNRKNALFYKTVNGAAVGDLFMSLIAGLVQATDGNFYGTTEYGGAYGGGTVFRITPSGALTTLYSFCAQSGCPDGESPVAAIVQATDGNFYGTMAQGGANGYGTIFKMTPTGTLTTLYNFYSQPNCTDGGHSYAGLVQDTNGELYGTTEIGGANTAACGDGSIGCGTVFRLSVGLGRFVETLPTAAKTGAPLIILGTNLTGASSVTLNGVPVSYSVNSTGTAITTTVPAETTTGPVQVVTPSGTLSSNLPFRVLPAVSSFAPTHGAIGTVVTINGQSLTQTTGVTFGGVPAAFAVVSDSEITATAPTGALTGSITVTTAGGVATAEGTFRVTPKIAGFSPSSGPVGMPVTINGQSFTQTTAVTFGGVTAAFTVNSDTEITSHSANRCGDRQDRRDQHRVALPQAPRLSRSTKP